MHQTALGIDYGLDVAGLLIYTYSKHAFMSHLSARRFESCASALAPTCKFLYAGLVIESANNELELRIEGSELVVIAVAILSCTAIGQTACH
jgi:hypothetical protein